MKKSNVEYPFEVRPLSKEEGGGYSIYFFAIFPAAGLMEPHRRRRSRMVGTRCSHGWLLRKSLAMAFPGRFPRSAGASCKGCRVRSTRG